MYLLFFIDVAVLFIHLFPQLELVISILALVLDFILIGSDSFPFATFLALACIIL